MAFCENCGADLNEDAKFCPECGQPVGAAEGTPSEGKAAVGNPAGPNAFDRAMATKDVTGDMDSADIQKNKVMAVLAYFGYLILIPIFFAKDSRFARYHVGQAFTLSAVEIILSLIVKIFKWIPILGWIIRILCWLVGVVVFVLAIIGIVNAAQGKAKALPLVGTVTNMFTE